MTQDHLWWASLTVRVMIVVLQEKTWTLSVNFMAEFNMASC